MKPSNSRHSQLRRRCRKVRAALAPATRDRASTRICDAVIRSGCFRRSRSLACYLPTDEEVDTWPIISRAWAMGKRVSAPVIGKNSSMQFWEIDPDSDLSANRFGLMEPQAGKVVEPRRLDIVVTPLVAFDDFGNRIGTGGGYFDRCFSFLGHRTVWLRPKLIGVAFDCQRVASIVPNPWDIKLFRVFTESS